ncbi:MAG: hypothetical protein PHG23_00545 [Candidatus Pacebacteria bacterium]|nr:hypothetical protein [Candidatus Paceibacterota bacterium]
MKTAIVLIILLLLSCALILSVPEFSMNQPNFKLSSNTFLAISQFAVSVTFIGSLLGSVLLGIYVFFWFWPEIICELALRKKTFKAIQAKKNIFLSDLAEEVGVREDELGILLKHWTAAGNKFRIDPAKRTLSGNHVSIDLANKQIFWED